MREHFSSRGVRNAAGDVLVRAPLPCFLILSFTVELAPGEEEPDAEPIADDLAAAVNAIGFTGRLAASLLHDVIHNSLPSRSAIVATDMLGRIRSLTAPTGRCGTIRCCRSPARPRTCSAPEPWRCSWMPPTWQLHLLLLTCLRFDHGCCVYLPPA